MSEFGSLSAVELLDRLQVLDRQRAVLEAERLEVLARYRELRSRDTDFDARSVPAEVALALHVSSSHAESQLSLAQTLTDRLPATLDAMGHGVVDLAKARALVDITQCLSVEDARAVEAKILPKAGERTLSRVRASARYHRDRVDPAAAERRRQQAKADRAVYFEPMEDGAAQLTLQGPGERVFLAWLLLDDTARRLRAAGDARSLSALRHDLMLDLILGKGDARVSVTAYLHVPATTLAGVGDDPGILSGYGPVTRQACQELAARDATWRRVFTDPVSGVVKDMDRRTYRPSATLAEFVAVRDGTCVAPGCTRSAHSCQVDHTIRWADGGHTVEGNLDALCWPDHRLKEVCGGGWRSRNLAITAGSVQLGRFMNGCPSPCLPRKSLAGLPGCVGTLGVVTLAELGPAFRRNGCGQARRAHSHRARPAHSRCTGHVCPPWQSWAPPTPPADSLTHQHTRAATSASKSFKPSNWRK